MPISKPFVASFVFSFFNSPGIVVAYMNTPRRFLKLNMRLSVNCRSSHNYCLIVHKPVNDLHQRSIRESLEPTTVASKGCDQLFQTVRIEAAKAGKRVWQKANTVRQRAGKVKKELEESEELQEEVNQV